MVRIIISKSASVLAQAKAKQTSGCEQIQGLETEQLPWTNQVGPMCSQGSLQEEYKRVSESGKGP